MNFQIIMKDIIDTKKFLDKENQKHIFEIKLKELKIDIIANKPGFFKKIKTYSIMIASFFGII